MITQQILTSRKKLMMKSREKRRRIIVSTKCRHKRHVMLPDAFNNKQHPENLSLSLSLPLSVIDRHFTTASSN